MALIYGEEFKGRSFSGTPISAWGEEAVMRAWQQHVENRAFLQFMYKKGTVNERLEASKELAICDKKLAFWERHPAFDKKVAGAFNASIAKNWANR